MASTNSKRPPAKPMNRKGAPAPKGPMPMPGPMPMKPKKGKSC